MTNQTTSAIVTPPQIIRAKTLVPNGKETDSSIHYDEFHPVTDADIVWFVNYLKNSKVEAIAGTDTAQKAIEKLDKKDDYIESKADTAQSTADTARREAQAAQSTADIARNEAQAAQRAANDATEIASSYEGNLNWYLKFKNGFTLQGGTNMVGSGQGRINFPITFSTRFSLVATPDTPEDSTEPGTTIITDTNQGNSSATIEAYDINGVSTSCRVFWFAFGY